MELKKTFKREFPKLFKRSGLLREPYKIVLREDTEPLCIYTPRHVPHPPPFYHNCKMNKMNRMEVEGVISPVTEPKRNRKIRLSVDQTALNKTVKREVHPMATVNQSFTMIQESKVFLNLMPIPVVGKFHWTIL